MKKSISIHDIAKELNISSTTISFVINGKARDKRISMEVEEKVLNYVKKIGFHPNMTAKSLRTGKSKIIGLMVENIADPFFSSIARIIEENTFKLGYKIFHSSTDNDTQNSKELIRIFRDRQVDGYIIAPAPGIEDDIRQLLNESKPVILFDRYFPELETTNVVVDNCGGASSAVNHLVNNGYKNIAFVTLDSDQVQMNDRLHGYYQAISENKLISYVQKIPYGTTSVKSISIIKAFINSNKSVDAILFATNYLALSGLKAIHELGLNVPDELGMVGFDDNSHFALFSPSITAVAQPEKEISKKTVLLLIEALSAGSRTLKKGTFVLPTTLVVRESSKSKVKKNNTGTI